MSGGGDFFTEMKPAEEKEEEDCPYFGGGTSVARTRTKPLTKPASKLETELAALSVSRQLADAERKDCDVVLPKPNELFLDIDNAVDLKLFDKQIAIFRRFYDVRSVVVRPSKSGGERKHIVVTLGFNVDDDEHRIFLQCMLGSDRTRELLGWIRAEKKLPALPCIFFEPRSKRWRRQLLDAVIGWWLS